jgi:hypothetical protein
MKMTLRLPFGFRDRLEVYSGPEARVSLRFLIDQRAGVRRDIDIFKLDIQQSFDYELG